VCHEDAVIPEYPDIADQIASFQTEIDNCHKKLMSALHRAQIVLSELTQQQHLAYINACHKAMENIFS